MANIAHRGHLKRLIKKGMIEARCKYHYTDDYAYDNATNFGITDWETAFLDSEIPNGKQVDGIVFMADFDFSTSSGGLYKDGENSWTLLIHLNLSYQIRFK